jgi:cell division initiation protein
MRRRLSPAEIRNKEFHKKLFGYDPEEVESFLMEVANAYQELIKEIERLKVRTPEYKTQELVEKAKKEIEKIVEKKRAEKEALEKKKEEVELEIEKLRLVQKKIYDRLKVAIIEMTRILEELKSDVKGEKEEGRDRNRGKSSTQKLKESSREGGIGEVKNKNNDSA